MAAAGLEQSWFHSLLLQLQGIVSAIRRGGSIINPAPGCTVLGDQRDTRALAKKMTTILSLPPHQSLHPSIHLFTETLYETLFICFCSSIGIFETVFLATRTTTLCKGHSFVLVTCPGMNLSTSGCLFQTRCQINIDRAVCCGASIVQNCSGHRVHRAHCFI